MVVIEQEPEDRKQNVENPPKASSDSTVNENGDASDGFETASERDVSDGESDDDEQKQEEHPIAPAKPEDRLNDDESKQVFFISPFIEFEFYNLLNRINEADDE